MGDTTMEERRREEPRYGRRSTDRDPSWTLMLAALRVVLVVVAVGCALWLVYALRTIILLLLLSILFAYLIAPLVDLVSRPVHVGQRQRRLSVGLAIGVVYLLLAGALTIAVAWLAPRLSEEAGQMAGQAPAYLQAVQDRAREMTELLNRLGLPSEARDAIARGITAVAGTIGDAIRRFALALVGLVAFLPWLILIPILAFFLLKDAGSFRRAALRLLPAGRLRENGTQLFERVNLTLAAYIRAQLIACAIVGVAVSAGFTALGVPYGLVFGVVAGFAEFIPLVGPFFVALGGAALAVLSAPILALWVLLFLGVVRLLEDYVIYPRLVGSHIDLHPLAVVLAVLAGAELAGVVGVFLSVPAVAVGWAAWKQIEAGMRGGEAAPPR